MQKKITDYHRVVIKMRKNASTIQQAKNRSCSYVQNKKEIVIRKLDTLNFVQFAQNSYSSLFLLETSEREEQFK